MSLFSVDDNTKYGVIIDIGSGSVLASIVESNNHQPYPNIIWAKREYNSLKQIESLTQANKNVVTALVNVLMSLDTDGRKVLREQNPKANLSHLQITVSAPWSYTVAKTISHNSEEPFLVTKAYVAKLIKMARKKVVEELKENEKIHNLGLELVSRTTADVVANGYSVTITGKQKANSLKIIELSVVVQESIVKQVQEIKEQLFPKAELHQYSFMLALFYTVIDLYENINDCCLVDITYESTEIGIVRDGVLQYCTHVTFGSVSLARELSAVLSIPIEEAHDYLRNDSIEKLLEKYSEKQKKDVKAMLLSYETRLTDLLHETGDKLSIPKMIFIHGNVGKTDFFKQCLANSAQKVTKSSHVVYDVTEDVVKEYFDETAQSHLKSTKQDTAMLVSAQFFHKRNYEHQFEQL